MKKIKKIISFWCLIFYAAGLFAQPGTDTFALKKDIGYDVEQKIDSLKAIGVDTVIQYFSFVVGWPLYIDSAGVYEIQFLIWTQHSKTYIQKFVNLNGSKNKRPSPIQINKQDIALFLQKNLNTIKYEFIYPYTYKTVVNNFEIYQILGGTHRKYSFFRIYTKDNAIQKEVFDSDFDEISFEEIKNLNYTYNSKTKIKLLLDLITTSVGKIDWH
ncbi:hypothetical protein [Ferruginibacter sp.]